MSRSSTPPSATEDRSGSNSEFRSQPIECAAPAVCDFRSDESSKEFEAARLARYDTQVLADHLQSIGLRATRRRIALWRQLFGQGHRHVTAEMLHEEATAAKIGVSLATIYNTLNQFTEAGLLRQIGFDGTKTYFDTNMMEHGHFLIEQTHELLDTTAPCNLINEGLNALPGYEVSRIDLVVRLRRKAD